MIRGVAPLAFALLIITLTFHASALAQTSPGSTPQVPFAAPAQTPSSQQLEQWRKDMRRLPPPHRGCFTSAYPSGQWHEVPCGAAPQHPYPPRRGPRAATVGNGNDVSAQVSSQISEAIGSFTTVTGLTSESGQVNGVGKQVSNTFSLQLNTNFFSGSPTCNGAKNPAGCLAWEQFVYSNSGVAFIQYWLIGYDTTCPAGWFTFSDSGGNDCYENGANSASVPVQTISALGNISLTGQAVAGGSDTIIMASAAASTRRRTRTVFSLWCRTGRLPSSTSSAICCGSQANFNSGSTIVVRTSVNSGTLNAPSCLGEEFTAETNNLNFASPPAALQEASPAILFTESSSGAAVSPCASATAVAGIVSNGGVKLADTHDFNGDGKSDVLWADTAGDVGLWLMNGAKILHGAAFSSVPLNWSIVGQRDFNGDGKADILWRDSAGDVGLWLMNGTQIVQGGSFNAVPLNWSVVGTGDFNGDGKADILWLDNQNNVGIWFMNGTQILQAGVAGQLPANWAVVGSDMKGDIFLRNTSTGDLGMWVMNGIQIVQNVDLGPLSLNWSVAGIGDFDGNGSSDILMRDASGNVQIWFMNGTQVLSTTVLGNVPTSWSIAATGDFNGDGDSDILWLDNFGNVGVWFINGVTVSSTTIFGNVGTAWRVQSLNAD